MATAGELVLLALPSVVALGVLALWGRASAAQEAALEAASPVGGTFSALTFLDQSLPGALSAVADAPRAAQLASLVLEFALIAVTWAVLRHAGGTQLRRDETHTPAVTGAVVTWVGSFLLTCAVGLDWLRWVAILGGAMVLVVALHHCRRVRNDGVRLRDKTVPTAVLVVSA